jgi:hypothetical protein
MTIRKFSLASAAVAVLFTAARADNIAVNSDFARPGTRDLVSSHPPVPDSPPTTDFTETLPNAAVDYAAAEDWLIWAGSIGGRVRTRWEPSSDWPGNYVLHVKVTNAPARDAGIDQVFLPPHTGPKHAWYCAVVKVVSGVVGAGVNDQGDARWPAIVAGPTGAWVRLSGTEGTTPVNQIYIYAGTANAEYYVKSVQVSTTPIDCKHDVAVLPNVLPPKPRLPDPYPWTLHPEQNGVVQPAGNPAQGAAPSPNGFFDNMTPGGVAHNDSEHGGHEPTHPVGGGGKTPATPATNTIQQQQPATQQQ